MKLFNPATQEFLGKVDEDTTESIIEKHNILKDNAESWQKVPIEEKLKKIQRFYKLLTQKSDDLAACLAKEIGKPYKHCLAEIKKSKIRINHFIEDAYLTLSKDNNIDEIDPLGTIANFSAWGYPILASINVLIPSLVSGNTVLYKPSKYVIFTGQKIYKLMLKAGIPNTALQIVKGDEDVLDPKILDLDMDGYFFAGAYNADKKFHDRVTSKNAPFLLLTGGKNAIYITEDNKNIKLVAKATMMGAFYNNGQSFCATERLYIHEKVYNDFLNEFMAIVKQAKVGNPMDDSVFTGPIIDIEHLDFLEDQVKDAVDKGAKLLSGGHKIMRKGYYFEPTVLVDVTHDMKIMKEESFGPIVGIKKVNSDEEAISLMKDSEYGVGGFIFSDDIDRATPIIDSMNGGDVFWNSYSKANPEELPWACFNHAGVTDIFPFLSIERYTRASVEVI